MAKEAPANPTPADCWSQQSPIDLSRRHSFAFVPPEGYVSLDYEGGPYHGEFVEKNGHWNLELRVRPDQRPPTLRLNGQEATLAKIHLHTRSEHHLDGREMAGEIHLIHVIAQPSEGSTLVVLGVFFEADEAAADTHQAASFVRAWADEGVDATDVDPKLLLPDLAQWYRYEGSLTSEPYDEVVSWLVFTAPLKIHSSSFDAIATSAHQPERKELQLRNRRFVLRNFESR